LTNISVGNFFRRSTQGVQPLMMSSSRPGEVYHTL